MNEIYETEPFTKSVERSTNYEKIRIEKIKRQLQKNWKIGKPLGYNWFREKYIDGKRMFYIIFIEFEPNKILLAAYATKKDQQEIINYVKENRDEFKKYLAPDYRTL